MANLIWPWLLNISQKNFLKCSGLALCSDFNMSVTAKGLNSLLMTMWYCSFSFLLNVQKYLHFCFFLSRWVQIIENKINILILANRFNEKFKWVWLAHCGWLKLGETWVFKRYNDKTHIKTGFGTKQAGKQYCGMALT